MDPKHTYGSDESLLHDFDLLNNEYQCKVERFLKNVLKIQRAEARINGKLLRMSRAQKLNAPVVNKGDDLKCSFCGLPLENTYRLFAGLGVFICDECVRFCCDILDNEEEQDGKLDEEANKSGTP